MTWSLAALLGAVFTGLKGIFPGLVPTAAEDGGGYVYVCERDCCSGGAGFDSVCTSPSPSIEG